MQYLKDVLLGCEAEFLASNGERHIWQLRDLVTVHNGLAAAQEGQGVTQASQLVLNLALCLIVG